MDTYSPIQRSALMSRIRSRDTKAEVRLRKALFARGLRYRTNVRSLPGTPDIVLRRYRLAIQVRGCFWHAHGCRRAHTPASNTAYWEPKLTKNIERDQRCDEALAAAGWAVKVVWECEIHTDQALQAVADELVEHIRERGERA